MSENNEGEEIVHKGNEWEVVALTESVYAAAPGPEQGVLDNNRSNLSGDDKAETAGAVFMSGHFGFSPSIHENLPVEPECEEKCCEKGCDRDVPQLTVQQGGKSDIKHEENLHIEGLISGEFPGVSQFDEKGNMSFCGSDFGDVASSKLIDKEQGMYNIGGLRSYDDDAAAGMPSMADGGSGIAEPSGDVVDPGMSNVQKHIEEENSSELPDLPCEVWWRRHAASLYGHVKDANPYWSIVVAAAVMGLVIFGYHRQRDKPHVFQLKSQLIIDDEGPGWILSPMTRLKNVTLGGRHGSYIRVSSFSEG